MPEWTRQTGEEGPRAQTQDVQRPLEHPKMCPKREVVETVLTRVVWLHQREDCTAEKPNGAPWRYRVGVPNSQLQGGGSHGDGWPAALLEHPWDCPSTLLIQEGQGDSEGSCPVRHWDLLPVF